MKIYIVRGELTGNSAKKEPLAELHQFRPDSIENLDSRVPEIVRCAVDIFIIPARKLVIFILPNLHLYDMFI